MKSRLHLFRWDKGPASREAVRMREALAAARAAEVEALDLDFGLGLYDYYADTLPRFFKLVAFVLRIPAGDRERGLESLARVARGGSLFHDDEARVQMYDVHSYFERKPDRALHWIREMWRLHPGWPLWGLKLSQLLGEPMGLWAESAAVARGILATADEGRHPNYQPVVAAMARVQLAEALLGDLRFEEACATARDVPRAVPGASWVGARVERVRARCLEIERRAGSAEGSALELLARSRRLREGGDVPAAEATCLRAFRAFPASDEARLCAARESLRAGRPKAALGLARAVLDGEGDAGLRPFARLALARALEDDGNRKDALAALPARVGRTARTRHAPRRSGGGDPAPRARRPAAGRPGARALREGPLATIEIVYSKYRTRSNCPARSPTFSSPATEGSEGQWLRGMRSLK